jgi:hypothetical protein
MPVPILERLARDPPSSSLPEEDIVYRESGTGKRLFRHDRGRDQKPPSTTRRCRQEELEQRDKNDCPNRHEVVS